MDMQRRDFLKVVGAGLCLAGTGRSWAAQDSADARPNIILCMADDQGWGDMAYNGHAVLKTPNFDQMAASALRFDRFYAAAPVCSPTRASVMTGRHPNRCGCFNWGNTLRPQEITIAEALKTAGYVTGHFGKWHLGSVQKGSPVNPGACGFDEWLSGLNFFDIDPILSREGRAVQMHGESSMVTVDAALEFIRKHAKSSRPFLAVVWFGSPHLPYQAAKEDAELYAEETDKSKQQYYGEISGMDRAFGKLRKELRTLGLHQDTILWYCSDNGGLDAKTTGGRGKKASIYEGGLRVPAILEWPARIRKPAVTQVPCNTSDIYPTLLEIAGVRMRHQPPLDGISLTALLDGRMKTRPSPMGFWQYPSKGIQTPNDKKMRELLELQKADKNAVVAADLCLDAGDISKQYPEDVFPGHAAWLDWPWKLHRIAAQSQQIQLELYDLSKDPNEAENRLADNEERATRMRAQLEAWEASVVRSLNGKDYPVAATSRSSR
jgi:arylsulfatase A-like enzyme